MKEPKHKTRLDDLLDEPEPYATFHDATLHKARTKVGKMGGCVVSMSRRELLKKISLTALGFGTVLEFVPACAKTDVRHAGLVTTVNASEQRDIAIDNLFRVNLTVRKNERVLVFTDNYKPVIIQEAEYVAKRGVKFGEIYFHIYPSTGLSGAEPPKSIWEKAFGTKIIREIEKKELMKKILEKKINDTEFNVIRDIVRASKKDVVDVVVALTWYSTTHTNFRKLLTRSAGVRYASMPGFDPRMWQTAMSADWEDIERRTVSLKNKLSGAISAHVCTFNETDIFLDLKDREFGADTGLLNQSGRSGNLPAGELSIAPVEGKANGKMVIEPGINPGVKSRLTFEIRDGRVDKINGDRGYISWLQTIFQKYPLARNIAELGIGTNEKAKIGTTMLESEKILGTIHIAIGDNSAMGGKIMVPFHIDFLFENPTVKFDFSDGRTLQILENGKVLW